MAETTYIREAETENEAGDRILLCYHTNEKKIKNSSGESIRYGVGLTMYTQRLGERTRCEKMSMEGIFTTLNEARRFVDVLWRGLVTPITLEDIVADCVG